MPAAPHDEPLTETLTGWEGACLARRCPGRRVVQAWGTEDGRTQQVFTSCTRCGRVELEPAPGMEQEPLPGMEGL